MQGRWLGVDYGDRRVGLAVSNAMAMLATPLSVEHVSDDDEAVAVVARRCAAEGAVGIVVGLPLNMNGSHGPMAQRATAFAERLKTRAGVPVHLWDERLSTSLVERALLEGDMTRQKRKRVRDKLAAQVILQSYLDAQSDPVSYDETDPNDGGL